MRTTNDQISSRVFAANELRRLAEDLESRGRASLVEVDREVQRVAPDAGQQLADPLVRLARERGEAWGLVYAARAARALAAEMDVRP